MLLPADPEADVIPFDDGLWVLVKDFQVVNVDGRNVRLGAQVVPTAHAAAIVEVADLRARGIEVADYDKPGLRTVDGVADVGFALSAWFVDPGGNTIGLLQFKDRALA